jgi:hypothetical protein
MHVPENKCQDADTSDPVVRDASPSYSAIFLWPICSGATLECKNRKHTLWLLLQANPVIRLDWSEFGLDWSGAQVSLQSKLNGSLGQSTSFLDGAVDGGLMAALELEVVQRCRLSGTRRVMQPIH